MTAKLCMTGHCGGGGTIVSNIIDDDENVRNSCKAWASFSHKLSARSSRTEVVHMFQTTLPGKFHEPAKARPQAAGLRTTAAITVVVITVTEVVECPCTSNIDRAAKSAHRAKVLGISPASGGKA